MPPKHRLSTGISGSGDAGSVSAEARMDAVDQGLHACRRMIETLVEKQKIHYQFLNGALCEIPPGMYSVPATPEIISTLCASHTMATTAKIMESMIQLEGLRNQLKSMFSDKTSSSAEQRQSYLMQLEYHTAMALQNGPPEEHLNPEMYQAEVRRDLELFRNHVHPILPPVSPEQRANAATHKDPNTLPEGYFEHIGASIEEPQRAEQHLKKASKQAPTCHIAWRLLALSQLDKLPSRKPQKIDRINESLTPLNYLAKVVELLPKDFRTWWHIAKHLYRTEVDFVGDSKLRSLIFITVNGKKYSSWDCFARVLELETNVPIFWLYLGQSLLRSHHPFSTEELKVVIAVEGCPIIADVSGRYCYETYARNSPPKEFICWLHVANAMLNTKDETVDVDDAFTSIELVKGVKLTRPEVLAKMVSVEPQNSEMWIFLYRAVSTEPDSYRLPLTGVVSTAGLTSTSVSAQECLAHAIELDPKNCSSWVAMYDHLHRRDVLYAQLSAAFPQLNHNKNATKMPHTCLISGKQYTKLDCALMAHQLTVVSPPSKKCAGGFVSKDQGLFDMWLIVSSMACASPNDTMTVPQGKEPLPLKLDTNNQALFTNKTRDISFPDAFIKAFESFKMWGCDVRLRLLRLLRERGDELNRRWPEAVFMMYDLLPKHCKCGTDCANCCLLFTTCMQLSKTTKAGAYATYLSANLNACASLEPEIWDELGKMLHSQKKKTTLFTNDETSQEYTSVDCFRQAIESPKRWNRAGTWLALGNALNEGEMLSVHDKPHTREDCFKQGWVWFDDSSARAIGGEEPTAIEGD